jgi:hypothetical protein
MTKLLRHPGRVGPINRADYPMKSRELREALGMTQITFWRHQAAGEFRRFELLPRIGHPKYNRKLVQAYLDKADAPTKRQA